MADEKTMENMETAETNAGAEVGAEQEKETLNAFQKFMKSIIGGDKKETEDKDTSEGKVELKEQKKEKSYSEEDFNAALTAEKKKWDDEQKEKERIAKLSPEEKQKVEAENNSKRIAELEQQLLSKDLHDEAVADLSKEGFPVELANLVGYGSKEEMRRSLETVKKTFKNCLATAINEKLKGKTPAGLGGAAGAENSERDIIAKNIRGGF